MRAILKRLPGVERYNQIVWAIIGSGVVAVVVFSITAGVAAMLYSAYTSRTGMQVAVVEEGGGAPTGGHSGAHYDFCQPVAVYGSPYQLIRVVSDQLVVRQAAVVSESKRKAAYSSYASEPDYGSCRIHGSERQTGTVNVIVRHAGGDSMRLLLKENAIIQEMEYPQPPDDRDSSDGRVTFPPAGTLYWEIAFGDSNDDKVIDSKDDLGAYLSDADGNNMVRITPEQSRVLEKTYDSKRNMLMLRILRDTNHDKALDDEDKASLIEVSVAKRKMTQEVLDPAMLAKMMREAEPKWQGR